MRTDCFPLARRVPGVAALALAATTALLAPAATADDTASPVLVAAAAGSGTGTATGPGAPVQLFSPQGAVKDVRQASARFAAPMVPFGDPRELDPFTIDCPAKGRGRWADPKNWVYDFDQDLPAGLSCTFTLKSGLKAVDGTPVEGTARYAFTTGGPSIRRGLPYEGNTIDENQVFILGLDAPATPASITAHAYCAAAGIGERIPVRLVTGDERKTILDARKSFAASYLRIVLLDEASGRTRSFAFALPASGSDDDRFRRLRDAPDSPLVTLACARTLPAGAEVKLVWGKGIAAASGVATTADQALAFKVRPAFRATFSCQRVNKNAQCLSLLPLNLSFTAPIAPKDVREIRLVDATGKVYPAKPPKGGDTSSIESVSFGPGLPEKTAFRLEIPAGLKDDAGRPLANAASFPLKVGTDELPPLAKFPADFGILEAVLPDKSTPLLPVTVRNVEPIIGGLAGTAAATKDGPPKDAAKASVGDSAGAKEGTKDGAKEAGKDAPVAAPTAAGTIPGLVAKVGPGDEMKIVDWLRRVEAGSRVDTEWDDKAGRAKVLRHGSAQTIFTARDAKAPIAVPKPLGAKAFEVVGIPLAAPGFYVVELASPLLGAALFGTPKPYYVRTAALVTNLGVTLKLGRESSLVWVTRLSDASPAANAQVAIRDCGGKTHWKGTTDANGIARIDVALPKRQSLPGCGPNERREYFVTARLGEDLSFAFSDWGEGIMPWRFNLPSGAWTGPYVAHAVLDRSLVRAGETVAMKLFVRKQTGDGFALVPRPPLPDTLLIRHSGSERKYTVPITWHGTQDGEASFAVPGDALTGSYDLVLRDRLNGNKEPVERMLGEFRVEAFRVPLLRARLQPVGAPWVQPKDPRIDVQVSYLAGGGAGGLPTRLRTAIEPRTTSFPDFEDYEFARGDVKVGREERSETGGFDLDWMTVGDEDGDEGTPARASARKAGREQAVTLDAAGGARVALEAPERSDVPRDLIAELEYRDPNGETQTAAARIPVWPARVLLAIRTDSWAASKERLKFTVAAAGVDGKPLAGIKIATDAFKREYYAHRRRLIGGFYAYDYGNETTRIPGAANLCSGTTDRHGLLVCDVKPPASGQVILRAQATDNAGNTAVTNGEAWIAGDDEWGFAASDNDRIDLLPERKRYEPGETARLQLRMPFKEATVLVTVEREGVLDAFVRKVDRSEPVLEVPMRGNYAPNVFVSAFAIRGRIGDVAPTALVDLAKPSYRMGLAEVRVGWAAHELGVKVTPDAAVYKVRAKAKVSIAVRRHDGSAPPKGSEVALAAVDEGLLELLPNNSWKLLDAMMVRRGEEVETATAQMQVIGRRHFGRKAVPAGGGGGRQTTRELFDTLLTWQARVPLDDAGNATVEVPLNDSLTGFRIVAVASGGAGLFGTGEASIRSTQDLILQAGLPPLVREGDRFRALLTVRNATQAAHKVVVSASYNGGTGRPGTALADQTVQLAAGEARELSWEASVPVGASRLDWQFVARGEDGAGGAGAASGSATAVGAGSGASGGTGDALRDAVKVTQKVVPAVPERTIQATLFQLTEPRKLAVERPADAIPGRGGISVRLQPKLGGDLADVRAWLERYPFTCFEQQVSAAIGLDDRRRWDALMRSLPDYLDRDGLLKYFTLLSQGDDTLTAYVLAVADEAGWKIPDEQRTRMEQALVGFVEGRIIRRSPLATADLSIRKIAALGALARGKAPFKNAWLDSIAIEPNLWPTSAVIDWYGLLSRVSSLPKRSERLAEATQILRSRLNFQGTTMGFSTEKSDALWWLMVSADSNANRLLLAVAKAPEWKEDLPRLATGAIGRMQRGRWNTTVANAWGVLALDRFAKAFEAAPVTGTTTVALGAERFDYAWPAAGAAASGSGGAAGASGTTGSSAVGAGPTGGAGAAFSRRLSWPSARSDLEIAQQGTGAPWVTVSSIAAVPLTAPLSTGYKITRTVTPIQQKVKDRWSRGDVARVRLVVDAQSDMTWVVVSDPIPAGATALGRGLGGDSTLLTGGERRQGAVWPAFEERTFEGYRGYYRYVPKGSFATEYTVRLNNAGTFALPPTRVEAMYAPEMFGEIPNAEWVVQP